MHMSVIDIPCTVLHTVLPSDCGVVRMQILCGDVTNSNIVQYSGVDGRKQSPSMYCTAYKLY